MSSSTLARTLSIKSNVKRADWRTWNFMGNQCYFSGYSHTFTCFPLPSTDLVNEHKSLSKRNFRSLFLHLMSFTATESPTWSSISVVIAGIFSPATVTEKFVLEAWDSINRRKNQIISILFSSLTLCVVWYHSWNLNPTVTQWFYDNYTEEKEGFPKNLMLYASIFLPSLQKKPEVMEIAYFSAELFYSLKTEMTTLKFGKQTGHVCFTCRNSSKPKAHAHSTTIPT